MLNLATTLTLARLALLPFILVSIAINTPAAAGTALTLYLIGAITDFLDGWVARKYNQITPLGTFLDPIADKIYVAAVMIALIAAGPLAGVWTFIVIVILTREFIIAGLREFLGPHNIQLPVTPLAKWKTASQMASLCFLILSPYGVFFNVAGILMLCASAVLTIMTGWTYFKAGLDHIKEMQ